ncbi:hypothetical protein GGI15_004468 [Coemansia interrupta]|uniref:Transcription factor TFIIIC triple barrel domain-containing protein n=1 Tax=Coemansia interrupta TaxID=1126814 RepID=A0A9W8LFC6_9FUNG|nr:hypothetical protein GGI15_004468 [Coemansia interrupta]
MAGSARRSSGPQPRPTAAGEDDAYDYDDEEYFVVASMPFRALDKAAEVANSPNRPGARVEKYNRRIMELKKLRQAAGQPQRNSDDQDDDNEDEDDDEDDQDEADDTEGSEYEDSGDNGASGDERRRRPGGVQRGRRVAQYALIDMHTARPMLELEGAIYQGTPDELLGTHLLLDIGADNEDGSERTRAELLGATSRTIIFHPVRMKKNPDYIL